MKKTATTMGIFLLLFLHLSASDPGQSFPSELLKDNDMVGLNILAVSCLSVRPMESQYYQSFSWGLGEGGLTTQAGNPDDMAFYAPVHLPDGAVIQKVIALYYDNNGSSYIEIQLGRVKGDNWDPDPVEEMVYFSSEFEPSEDKLKKFKTSTITYPTIDNTYVYFIMVGFDVNNNEDVLFRGVWIAYL